MMNGYLLNGRNIRVIYSNNDGSKTNNLLNNQNNNKINDTKYIQSFKNKEGKYLYIKFSKQAKIPSENEIYNVFNRYGKVTNVIIKIPAGLNP